MIEAVEKKSILREVPFFSGLSDGELRAVEGVCDLHEYRKDEIIYLEGSAPSAFYCIIWGRVVVYTQPDGQKNILEYLHRGKYFGIISLLTLEPHSVTAQAINDCLLLVIKKDDFDHILKTLPSLAIDLSRTLSRRLKRKDIHKKTIFESTIVSVYSSYSQAGKTVYSLNLSLSLASETGKSVIIVDILPLDKIPSLPRRLGINNPWIVNLCAQGADNYSAAKDFITKSDFGADLACFYYEPEDASCVKKLVGFLSLLVNDYHYIILDLPSVMDRPVFSILNQSDLIHILTSPETVDLARTRHLVERLKQEFNFNDEKIKVVINEYKDARLTTNEEVNILGRQVFATLPKIDLAQNDRLVIDIPRSEYAKAVRRVARNLGECSVGLVLGVGAAYGFCHIGVLKVIEEEKIPVDVIAGSSIGALIASLWVTGKSSAEILEITKFFKEPKDMWGLIDLTFPRFGFIKGNKLYSFLKKYLGNKTFHDVRLPLKIVASDVKRKLPRILDKGLLADAVMASCSMPGIFRPFKFREEVLYDGGVINPLPTEALLTQGIKKIIAVNVTPSKEDISLQYKLIKPKRGLPVLDVIFGSIEALQSEIAKKEELLADVVLRPDTQGLYWLQLHRAEEFAKRGEEEAIRKLPKIWEVVNE